MEKFINNIKNLSEMVVSKSPLGEIPYCRGCKRDLRRFLQDEIDVSREDGSKGQVARQNLERQLGKGPYETGDDVASLLNFCSICGHEYGADEKGLIARYAAQHLKKASHGPFE